MDRRITYAHAPALGDVRAMSTGDTVWVHANADQRRDWARYVDAIATAVSRGAEVRRRWGL
ncbi:hypothetical protein FFZ77_29635 [Streptomyces katsurahamanus]|uniref:Long-chain fatty acid--CoA ligase n=1 Tax=Streptomyces katsurahamanus TaxID=2577098 RepID=A0ABW9P3E2_9ACTN|nr:hypothetical protein [Streptomyces katsurahamanus]